MNTHRRIPVGAEVIPEGGVHFRTWAPAATTVEVVLEAGPGQGITQKLIVDEDGYAEGEVFEAGPGTRYRLRLDGGTALYPDPASRYQPEGPHGASEVVDATRFAWTDHRWSG